MKKKVQKIVSALLTLMLLVQIVQMSVYALDASGKENVKETTINELAVCSVSEMPNIVCEITENRDEYSKEYLLDDGSFSKVISGSPIHNFQNEEWVETFPENNMRSQETGNSVAALSFVGAYNFQRLANSGGHTNRWKLKSSEGAIVITPQLFYPNSRCIVTSASLEFYCDSANVNLTLRKNMTSNNLDSATVLGFPVIDIKSTANSGNVTMDLTDTYKRWLDGVDYNYGLVLQGSSSNGAVVCDFSLTINYKYIDANDNNFSYYSIDMDNIGTGYVNNYSKYFYFEQSIMPLDSKLLPSELTRLYNVKPIETANAGYVFNWNVESSIDFSDDVFSWDTFTGEIKRFVSDETPVIINGYQVWRVIGENETDNTTVLLYVLNSAYINDELSFENIYIKQGNTEYFFDDEGRLVSISSLNSNGTEYAANIIYGNDNEIIRLETETGIKYDFTYSNNNVISENYITSITIRDANNNQVTELDSNNNTVNSGAFFNLEESLDDTILNTLSRNNMENVVCESDYDGCLLTMSNSYEKWIFDYSPNAEQYGKIIEGFTKYDIDSLGFESEDYNVSFENVGSYYRKIIRTENNAVTFSEDIQFDRDHRVTYLRDSEGKHLCFEYDSNGLSSAYAFNSLPEDVIYYQGFEASDPLTGMSCSVNVSTGNSTWVNSDHGNCEAIITASTNTHQYLSDTIENNYLVDKTYAIGAWIKVNDSIPSPDRQIEFNVSFSNNTLASRTLDNTLNNEWQYIIIPFKLSSASSIGSFSFQVNNQMGDVRLDDITLFESENTQINLEYLDLSSPITYEYYSNGYLKKEMFSDGILSLNRSYTYDDFGEISSTTDEDGLTTYYEGSSYVKRFGTQKDINGDIVDATEFHYSGTGVLQSITQVINGLPSSTVYTTTGNQINAITHNGYEYRYYYDNTGRLEKIQKAKYNQTSDLFEYGYTNSGNIGYISFSSGDEIEYSYDNSNKITEIKCHRIDPVSNVETVYSDYVYSYNISGNVSSITDSLTGDVLSYSGNGYSIIVNNTTLYNKSVDANQNTVHTYRQASYTGTGYTSTDTMTVSSVEENYNNSNGMTEKTQSINIVKNANLGPVSEMDCEATDTYDYFNRINSFTASIEYSQDNTNLNNTVYEDISREYIYKDLSFGVTSGLVSSYSYNLSGEQNGYERKYEYDGKGNIVFVYSDFGNGNIARREYYEYDDLNQVTTEVNFDKQLVAKYTYNSGGNIVSKKYYDFSEISFNESTHQLLSTGNTVIKEIDFSYGNPWKDQMVSVQKDNQTANTISYDEYGNPLYYYGIDHDNSAVDGSLEWNGNKLVAYETARDRIEFSYNEQGLRIKKTVFDKIESNGNVTYSFSYSFRYLWDNNRLEGVLYKGGTNLEEQSIMIMYDQAGTPFGYVTAMGNFLLYKKDLKGNVIGLYSLSDGTFASYNYDSWGKFSLIGYGSNFLAEWVAYGTALLNPITFNGMIYDWETGLYCDKGRFYSPTWGRYINPDSPETISFSDDSVLDANMYLYNSNNPVNGYYDWKQLDTNTSVSGWNSYGINVEASIDFASRSVCSMFANDFVRKYGTWNPQIGYNYLGMNSYRIASDLFAHCIGKYAPSAIDRVNKSWGDGWISSCSQSNTFNIRNNDINAWKYKKIWESAKNIKPFASTVGLEITL